MCDNHFFGQENGTYFPTRVRKQEQREENPLNNFGNSGEEDVQQFHRVHHYRNNSPINDAYKCVLLSNTSHECPPSSRSRVSKHQGERQAMTMIFRSASANQRPSWLAAFFVFIGPLKVRFHTLLS